MAFAERLAAGPTMAHAATKRMVRAQLEHGRRGADERIGEIAGALFETEDLKRAVEDLPRRRARATPHSRAADPHRPRTRW